MCVYVVFQDKILQSVGGGASEKVTVTNDGATILKSIPIDNPAAKIIVDTSMTQDAEVPPRDPFTAYCRLCHPYVMLSSHALGPCYLRPYDYWSRDWTGGRRHD